MFHAQMVQYFYLLISYMLNDLQVNIYHHSSMSMANQNIHIAPAGDETGASADPPRKRKRLPSGPLAKDPKGISSCSLVGFPF